MFYHLMAQGVSTQKRSKSGKRHAYYVCESVLRRAVVDCSDRWLLKRETIKCNDSQFGTVCCLRRMLAAAVAMSMHFMRPSRSESLLLRMAVSACAVRRCSSQGQLPRPLVQFRHCDSRQFSIDQIKSGACAQFCSED